MNVHPTFVHSSAHLSRPYRVGQYSWAAALLPCCPVALPPCCPATLLISHPAVLHPQRKPWGSMSAAVADALTVVADRPRVLAGVPPANQVLTGGGTAAKGACHTGLVVSLEQAHGYGGLVRLQSANQGGPRLGPGPGPG